MLIVMPLPGWSAAFAVPANATATASGATQATSVRRKQFMTPPWFERRYGGQRTAGLRLHQHLDRVERVRDLDRLVPALERVVVRDDPLRRDEAAREQVDRDRVAVRP